jgi:hypothetical protein
MPVQSKPMDKACWQGKEEILTESDPNHSIAPIPLPIRL